MNSLIQATPLSLPKGGISVQSDAFGSQIRCEQGVLWVTQDNDTRDIVLAAGESFQPDRKGTVLVYALERASLSWGPAATPASASPWRQLGTWLAAHFARRITTFVPARQPAFE